MDKREADRHQVDELLQDFASAIRQAKADNHATNGSSVLDGLLIGAVIVADDTKPITPPEL